MNVTTMTMAPEEARAKLRAYRANRHKDAELVYRQCEQFYEELADGAVLIDAEQAIIAGGFDHKMRPNIAIARSDREQVRFTWHSSDFVGEFNAISHNASWGGDTLRRRINFARTPNLKSSVGNWFTSVEGYARIPMVPADVRPKTGQLRDWFTLWEVEKWSDSRIGAPPPRDPFLLRHVGGTLYAVLAEWNLTELERAVMRQQGARV